MKKYLSRKEQENLVKHLLSLLDKYDTYHKENFNGKSIFDVDERIITVDTMLIRDFEKLYYAEAWKLDDDMLAKVQNRYFQ